MRTKTLVNLKLQQESEEENNSEENGLLNPYYRESQVNVVLHHAVPRWTGLMLTPLGKTRDSNAVVQNWFCTTKTVTSKLHQRAGDFLHLAIKRRPAIENEL